MRRHLEVFEQPEVVTFEQSELIDDAVFTGDHKS